MTHAFRKIAVGLTAIAAAAGCALLASGPAIATTSPTLPPAQKCLEIYNGPHNSGGRDLTIGAFADQWTCYPGHANQEWAMALVNSGGRFGTGILTLRSSLTNMCLEVYNGPHGRPLQKGLEPLDVRQGAWVDQWTCFTGHFNQEWEPKPVTTSGRFGHPVVEFVNRQSNKCLEVFNGSHGVGGMDLQIGARVDQWTCYPGHANQEWELIPATIGHGNEFLIINENG